MHHLVLALAALFGSTLAGVTGFGGAAVLLPVLVWIYGAKASVPILTVAQLIGNGSRVYFHRRELNWKIVLYFAIGAIPSALLGSFVFAKAPVPLLLKVMGIFLLATVAWRWTRGKTLAVPRLMQSPKAFFGVGLVFSFVSAIVGSVGPFIVPFFLSYGLVKSAFIGTEALCTVTMHVVKILTYQQTLVLGLRETEIGLALGPIMIFGSWLGKKILAHVPEHIFVRLIECTLIVSGLIFIFK